MAALLYASRMADCPYEIVLVASNKCEAEGLALAETEGVKTVACSSKGLSHDDHDKAMELAVLSAGADYILLAGYMRILGSSFVSRWTGKIINIHPSLLPKYKGLETHRRAIEDGEKFGGATVHIVTAELDAGEILDQVSVVIAKHDNPETLAKKVKIAEHQLYPRALTSFLAQHKLAEDKQ